MFFHFFFGRRRSECESLEQYTIVRQYVLGCPVCCDAADPTSLIWNIDQRNVMQMKRFELKIYCHDLIVIKDSTEHSSMEPIYFLNVWRSFSYFPFYLLLLFIALRTQRARLVGLPSLTSPFPSKEDSCGTLLRTRTIETILAGSIRSHQCLPHLSSANGGGWIVLRANCPIDHRNDIAHNTSSGPIVCVFTFLFRGIYFYFILSHREWRWWMCARSAVHCDMLSPEHRTAFLFQFAPTDKHFLSLVRVHCSPLVSTATVASTNCNLDSIVTAKHKFIDFNCIFHFCGERSDDASEKCVHGNKNWIKNASLLHGGATWMSKQKKTLSNSRREKMLESNRKMGWQVNRRSAWTASRCSVAEIAKFWNWNVPQNAQEASKLANLVFPGQYTQYTSPDSSLLALYSERYCFGVSFTTANKISLTKHVENLWNEGFPVCSPLHRKHSEAV